jgi:hypothetical protein
MSIQKVAARLTSVPGALRAAGYSPPDYRGIRDKAVNGLFPAHQINGIWHFHGTDIEAIAGALGLERLPVNHKRAA